LDGRPASLRVAFKWMVRAFSGYLSTDQLLLLWDRVLAYDSLEILAGTTLPTMHLASMCNILNSMCNTTSQKYLAIVPFTVMCNIPIITCNTTSQYHCQFMYFLLNISCLYCFSFRPMYCTFIILLFLFLCCCYF